MALCHHSIVVFGLAVLSSGRVHNIRETALDQTYGLAATELVPQPTPIVGRKLLARQDPGPFQNTCGYIDGDAAQPVGCNNDRIRCLFSGTVPRNWVHELFLDILLYVTGRKCSLSRHVVNLRTATRRMAST
jgi:hypothetical protein